MTFISRHTRLVAVCCALLGMTAVQAQDYPSKPIRIIAPVPIGTGPDANTREIALELSKVLGQAVVVENRPGASSMIGMEAAAKAAPDGYTLVMGLTSSMSVVPHLYSKVPYNAERDFVPISLAGLLNTALIANPSVTQNSARELMAQLKAQPESMTAATSGIGSYSHLAGEWFGAGSNTKIKFVPYNTSSPYTDLVGGQVQLMFDALPVALGNVRAGKLKVLALTGKTRHPNFPDVPTFAEAGLPDYTPTAWIGLFAPAGTPAAIVDKLSAAMQKATTQNQVLADKWRSYGGELKSMTPVEFSAFLKSDSAKWGQAIRHANIKLD
ncbi:tripartite tricarboxylate transporter substrate binding protein [Limnohabitans sp. JirII-31]|uniref:Bug family tripartite tricarboxylate transporter substrate binding protein n=1 Tax=Limnohabitans sp. JirII-31 TaxID=1977908 RepID=UPI000C1E08BB|nr:tripartite tricarboxylate transporter substrate binding protein [Limnohabitans sp. JirII-31]PIT75181.1 ABC transporter substrate-binding protein [Limnohabitans sp. JirII-31]